MLFRPRRPSAVITSWHIGLLSLFLPQKPFVSPVRRDGLPNHYSTVVSTFPKNSFSAVRFFYCTRCILSLRWLVTWSVVIAYSSESANLQHDYRPSRLEFLWEISSCPPFRWTLSLNFSRLHTLTVTLKHLLSLLSIIRLSHI